MDGGQNFGRGGGSSASARNGGGRITGHVTWLYAFDIAHDMRREPLVKVLGQAVEAWARMEDHRVPRQSFFHRPQLVRLPALYETLPGGRYGDVQRALKILPVGGLSISITAAFSVENLLDLVLWHEPIGHASPSSVRELVKQVMSDLADYLIQPVERLDEADAYTVFRLDPPDGMGDGLAWLEACRKEVAALLTQESDSERLCEEEVSETLARRLGYYRSDVVVVDWDAALVVEQRGAAEEILHVLELANLQLCELEAYDRILDTAMDRSYGDLGRERFYNRALLGRLGELRIDLSRLSDELTHAGKFLGDWHLARVYEAAAARFHLADWQRVVDDKLKTLDDLYQVLKHDQFNRWLLGMEMVVILILIFDLAMLLYPFLRH